LNRQRRPSTVTLIAVFVALCRGPALGYSLLPLVTEDPVPVPSGITQLSLSLAYAHDGVFPFFTPPETVQSQDVLGAPQLGLRIGAGGWVEILASYELIYLDQQLTDGEHISNYGSGDARIATKVRLLEERVWFPALSLFFGTKLPNAKQSAHLGTDTFDFACEGLASKQLGPVKVIANLGLVLMDIPVPLNSNEPHPGGQDDVVGYSVAVASRPLEGWSATSGRGGEADPFQFTLLAEVAGLAASHFDNDRSAFRAGVQVTHGAGTFYLGISAGLISESEQIGANTGFIYTFDVAELFAKD
jgi:hypothetical protein